MIKIFLLDYATLRERMMMCLLINSERLSRECNDKVMYRILTIRDR